MVRLIGFRNATATNGIVEDCAVESGAPYRSAALHRRNTTPHHHSQQRHHPNRRLCHQSENGPVHTETAPACQVEVIVDTRPGPHCTWLPVPGRVSLRHGQARSEGGVHDTGARQSAPRTQRKGFRRAHGRPAHPAAAALDAALRGETIIRAANDGDSAHASNTSNWTGSISRL